MPILGKMSAKVRNLWTDDERRFILKHHKDMFIEDIAEALGRPVSSTTNTAYKIGCSTKRKPTSEGDTK